MARQLGLHAWLIAEMPPGALQAPIRVRLSEGEVRELERPVRRGPGPLRIGLVKPVVPAVGVSGFDRVRLSKSEQPVAGGVLRSTDDGGFVWAASVTSEGAGGLRVRLKDFRLPPGADLYFFSLTGEAYGPYQRRGPHGNGDFWSESIADSHGVVLLRHFGPATPEDLREVSFVITEVGHIGARPPVPREEAPPSSFCDNPSCIVDATCYNVQAVADAKNAVAKMEWISGAWIYTCTGGLVADTDPSTQIPYFLTANHCLKRSRDAQSLELWWFFRTQTCNGTCPTDTAYKTYGATLKATGADGDFTLLELSQTPPAGTVLLGWNNSPVAFTDGLDLYRISHPNYGPQVYTYQRVDTSAGTCSGWPRGESIYSRDIEGATDGGSSGAPVLNGSGQIVGQLSGACGYNVGDPCDAVSNATVDGALAFYWDSVKQYLDPIGGCTPSPEVCSDGIDNDCDDAVDCADPDCTGDPACACKSAGESCTSNAECCSNSCKGRPGARTCR